MKKQKHNEMSGAFFEAATAMLTPIVEEAVKIAMDRIEAAMKDPSLIPKDMPMLEYMLAEFPKIPTFEEYAEMKKNIDAPVRR